MIFDFKSYEAILPFLGSRRILLPSVFPDLFDGLKRGAEILDIGCGDAILASALAAQTGANVTAIDPEPSAIVAARNTVIDRNLEKRVQVEQIDWVGALNEPSANDLILCVHLIYHIDRTLWSELIRSCYDRLKPGGRIVFVTTSKTAKAHNYFCSSDVIKNIVGRSANLEAIYGNYVFGEDLEEVLAISDVPSAKYTRDFEISWPFSKSHIKFAKSNQIDSIGQSWLRFFSFLYRLPPEVIREEFNDQLETRLKVSQHDLSIKGRDVIHVIRKS